MPDDFFPAKTALSGLPPQELAALLAPLPSYRAKQIFKWIAFGLASFDEMSNLPLSLREDLKARFHLRSSAIDGVFEDSDNTVKLRIKLEDDSKIEAVLLSDSEDRRTACLSTQAGCPAGCVFCKTGALGFLRSLSSAEIVEQFLYLRESAAAAAAAARSGEPAAPAAAAGEAREIANIVIMGMGEPLLNLGELRKALEVICHREGMGISPRRITVSTCGIPQGIVDLADKGPPVRLALSLTSADEELRNGLMPLSKKYSLREIKEALVYFQGQGGGRITLEAVLLSGLNTGQKDAEALALFSRGLDAVLNLIPWNPVQGLEFQGRPLKEPSGEEIESFTRMITARGLKVTRRYRKGRGVMGACGQLGVLSGEVTPDGVSPDK
jgi:23S rRNA (adenine2503-C2)-methyltransferase